MLQLHQTDNKTAAIFVMSQHDKDAKVTSNSKYFDGLSEALLS